MTGHKYYFISDAHLGLYPVEESKRREKLLVNWLDTIKHDVRELFLMGDIFDFWHEYKRVVPRGFVRFLGKLSEISDLGVPVHFFTGNHDIWVYDYLTGEIGMNIYRKHIIREINDLRLFIGHGDGLGSGDTGYKLLKSVFTSKILQWLFARIHPNFSMWFGQKWSKSSRFAKGYIAEPYRGDDKEQQVVFAREKLKSEHFDYFIFGHRHVPFEIQIGEKSKVINLGDWINNFSYAVIEGNKLELKSIYPEIDKKILRKKFQVPDNP
ncbi:MAG: UDP-2,3-diacylglucosamine diphosphatase [Bacteroidales bacterium]|nr:UDP-2,3-diacylglucosamine diphosphatase [Bacteroidales bacterium]